MERNSGNERKREREREIDESRREMTRAREKERERAVKDDVRDHCIATTDSIEDSEIPRETRGVVFIGDV